MYEILETPTIPLTYTYSKPNEYIIRKKPESFIRFDEDKLIGKTIGFFTILEASLPVSEDTTNFKKLGGFTYLEEPSGRLWLTRCICGKLLELTVEEIYVRESCGCVNRERNRKRFIKAHIDKGHRMRSEYTEKENEEYDRLRGFYSSKEWRKVRKEILHENGRCVKCGEPATLVHHIYSKFFFNSWRLNKENLVSMCNKCHGEYHNSLVFNCSIPSLFERWLNV